MHTLHIILNNTYLSLQSDSVASWLWPMLATILIGTFSILYARLSAKSAKKSADQAEEAHKQVHNLNKKAARPWLKINSTSILENHQCKDLRLVFENIGVHPLNKLCIEIIGYPEIDISNVYGVRFISANPLSKGEEFTCPFPGKSSSYVYLLEIKISYRDVFYNEEFKQKYYMKTGFDSYRNCYCYFHVDENESFSIMKNIYIDHRPK